MAATKDLNLDDILDSWAKDMGYKGKGTLKFDLSRVRFEDDPPNFYNNFQRQSNPNTEVIFEDVFKNGTDSAQKHRIRCKRETTSFAKFDLSQSIIHENQTKLKLYKLPEVCTGSSGFAAPLVVNQLGRHEFVEKLTWTIDEEITVPPRSTVKANISITEHSHETAFQVKTKIRGNVHCDVIDNPKCATLDGDIKEILRKYLQDHSSLRGALEYREGEVSFLTKGTCHFRYGVSKIVHVI